MKNTTTFERATIYTRGGLGGVVRTEVRNLSIETGVSYAQYTDAVRVTFTPKGKRKPRGMTLTYRPFLVVVEGAGPEIRGLFGAEKESGTPGVTVRESRYTCFDERFDTDARADLLATGAKILFQIGLDPSPA